MSAPKEESDAGERLGGSVGIKVQVVAYYTDRYKGEVRRLKGSLDKLGIDGYIHPMPDQGSWAQNVMVKPAFILGCLNAFKTVDGIFYTDADSEFLSLPDWEKFNDCHISYHRFQRSGHHAIESLTGSMYFCNSPTTKRFVAEWCEATKVFGTSFTPEQDSLKVVMDRWQDRISWKDCGADYCYIFDDFRAIYPKVAPVIRHMQASRRLRK